MLIKFENMHKSYKIYKLINYFTILINIDDTSYMWDFKMSIYFTNYLQKNISYLSLHINFHIQYNLIQSMKF